MTRSGVTRRSLIATGASLAASVGVAAQAERKHLAERLGKGAEKRLLILHADDVGMCHSVNTATTRAMTEGVASSGSIMVPCPWFPEIAAWSREHPTACLGLHLTLTSEWKYYRWRPVAPITEVPTLLDSEGFMPRSVEEVKAKAKPEHVEAEIRAQIRRALEFGLKPTHVDSHMGTLFADPRFFDAYVRVARETRLLPMLPGPTPDIVLYARSMGLDYLPKVRGLESQGYVFLDRLSTGLSGETLPARKAALAAFLDSLTPGVTKLIVHLAGEDEEIQNISYSWKVRGIEGRMMVDPEVRALLKEKKVELTTYREVGRLWQPA